MGDIEACVLDGILQASQTNGHSRWICAVNSKGGQRRCMLECYHNNVIGTILMLVLRLSAWRADPWVYSSKPNGSSAWSKSLAQIEYQLLEQNCLFVDQMLSTKFREIPICASAFAYFPHLLTYMLLEHCSILPTTSFLYTHLHLTSWQ